MRAFKHAESLKRHELKEVFSDVYGGEEPLNLVGVFPRSSPAASSTLAIGSKKLDTLPLVLTEGTTGRTD